MNALATPNQAFANCAYKEVREKQAEAFTNYLNSRPGTCGYVANLNGAWGTGKTFFVDNWCTKLSEQGYVSVKIDAWESDYLNDPLAIVTAEILTQLKKRSGREDFAEKEKQIFSAGWKLAKNFLPVLTMALGKHYLGKDYESLLKEIGVSVKGTIDDKSAPAPDFGDFGKEMFATHDKHQLFKRAFISNLSDLVQDACEISGKPKVYVFIDELDRCRPTYAIEMLEVVKHLFDIPNMVFVLSTDTTQLECSIKAVYGEQFDSEEYLSRFFQRRLSLSKPDYLTFIRSQNLFSQVEFNPDLIYPSVCIDTAQEMFAIICEINSVSYRRAEQISARIESALINLPKDTAVSFIELISNVVLYEMFPKEDVSYFLAYMREPYFQHYDQAKKRQTVSDADTLFGIYQDAWSDLGRISKNLDNRPLLREAEQHFYQRVREMTTQAHKIKNKKGIQPLIYRHFQNGQTPSDRIKELATEVKTGNMSLLEGKKLNDYLHLFDSFS
ncbi:KAP family P-loop NTPase fold protein [Vibrio diabolicus]|uniref:KAP family P-loop NTPase fold protein n=1 Tax=Vibrio diabolicus TaxID=50719 RepID=UPI0037523AF8